MADDAQVKVGADASEVVDETTRAARAAARLADAVKKLKKRFNEADKSLDSFADEAERMNRVSMILGGTFGDLTGGLDDFATLMQGGAGAATALGATAVVATAGILKLAEGAAHLTASIVSVINSTDDYVASMSNLQRDQWDEQIASARSAKLAFDGLQISAGNFALLASAELAPAMQQVADAMTGTIEAAISVREEVKTLASVGTDLLLPFTTVFQGLGAAIGSATSSLAEYGKSQREANAAQKEGEQIAQDYLTALEAIDEVTLKKSAEYSKFYAERHHEQLIALGLLDEEDKTTLKVTKQKARAHTDENAALRTKVALHKEVSAAFSSAFASVQDYSDSVTYLSDEALVTMRARQDEYTEAITRTQEALDRQAESAWHAYAMDAERIMGGEKGEKALLETRLASAAQWVHVSAQVADTVGGLLTWVADHSIKEERKAAKVRLAGQLIQAAAGTAMAVVNALQTVPFVPLGVAAAVAAGIAGATQIGIIAAQKGKLHRGGFGLQPDEARMGATTVLQEERTLTLTREAQRQLGGEDGAARMNAGLGPQQSDGAAFILDGRRYTKRRLAAPDPGYGQWSPA